MPARIWVWIGFAIGLIVIAYIVLAVAVPRDGEDAAGTDGTPDESAQAEAPPEEPPDAGIDPELLAALDTAAAMRSVFLPQTDGMLTLHDVRRDGGTLVYDYSVTIDIDTAEVSDPLPPALASFDCDEDICFEIAPSFIAEACGDGTFVELMEQGAAILLDYSDANGRPIAAAALSREVCSQ